MNPYYEQVIVLFKEGYSPEEIAQQLPLTLETVASICIVEVNGYR